MIQQYLCTATFAEAIRPNMNTKSIIKSFDDETKIFNSTGINKDCSGVFNFYTLLFDSLTYNTQITDSISKKTPDMPATKMTMIKKRKDPIPKVFIELAQHADALKSVSYFFASNVIPNISKRALNSVLDAVDTLCQNDSSLGKETQKNLKGYRTKKSPEEYLAEVWLRAVARENKCEVIKRFAMSVATDEKSDNLIERLPIIVSPPAEESDCEIPYIIKLMAVYGEVEKIDDFSKVHLDMFPRHLSHFHRQREDFYAAESVKQSTRDVFGETEPNHFEVLMKEIYGGIIDKFEQDYKNGLERLREVLNKATDSDVGACYLQKRTLWIGASQKKGVCHMLANENRITSWVHIYD